MSGCRDIKKYLKKETTFKWLKSSTFKKNKPFHDNNMKLEDALAKIDYLDKKREDINRIIDSVEEQVRVKVNILHDDSAKKVYGNIDEFIISNNIFYKEIDYLKEWAYKDLPDINNYKNQAREWIGSVKGVHYSLWGEVAGAAGYFIGLTAIPDPNFLIAASTAWCAAATSYLYFNFKSRRVEKQENAKRYIDALASQVAMEKHFTDKKLGTAKWAVEKHTETMQGLITAINNDGYDDKDISCLRRMHGEEFKFKKEFGEITEAIKNSKKYPLEYDRFGFSKHVFQKLLDMSNKRGVFLMNTINDTIARRLKNIEDR